MGEFNFEEDEPPNVPEGKGYSGARKRLINYRALCRAVEDKRDAAQETLSKKP